MNIGQTVVVHVLVSQTNLPWSWAYILVTIACVFHGALLLKRSERPSRVVKLLALRLFPLSSVYSVMIIHGNTWLCTNFISVYSVIYEYTWYTLRMVSAISPLHRRDKRAGEIPRETRKTRNKRGTWSMFDPWHLKSKHNICSNALVWIAFGRSHLPSRNPMDGFHSRDQQPY